MYKDWYSAEVDILLDFRFGDCHFQDGPYRQNIHLSLFLREIAKNDVEFRVVLASFVGKLHNHAFLAFPQEDRNDEIIRLQKIDVDLRVICLKVLGNDALQCF